MIGVLELEYRKGQFALPLWATRLAVKVRTDFAQGGKDGRDIEARSFHDTH
jgi:hypothetical protein